MRDREKWWGGEREGCKGRKEGKKHNEQLSLLERHNGKAIKGNHHCLAP